MSPMDLRETSLGFHRAWHAAIGTRHGLVLALRDAPLAPHDLASELGLDADAVERWCEGAWALGILERDRARRYRLREEHHETLGEPTSTKYLGHHFEYLTQKSLTFDALDGLLRGAPAKPDLSKVYAIATKHDHNVSFDAMDAPLREALARGIDVLDLGAGEGGWTREAMWRFPRSRFAAADLDTAPLAELHAARVLHVDQVPSATFDLVFLGEVLAATKDPVEPLRTAHRALKTGGRLLAIEGLRPPEGRAPRGWGEKLVLAMALDFSMDGSRFLTEKELKRAAREAGFPRVALRDLGGSLFAITARKA